MTRISPRFLGLLLLSGLAASPALAQMYNAGDACPEPTAGRVVTAEGAAGPALVCNGTTLEVYESVLTGPLRKGIGTATPQATLDVSSTDSVLLPRGTTAERPGTPVNGMIRYNSTLNKFEAYENGAWTNVIGGGGSSVLSSITAATGTNTIASGDNAQVWNWALTTATKDAFTFGETTAATGGSGDQSVLKATTLASSTAVPLMVTNLGDGASFRVNDETGDSDTTPFVIDASGRVGIGNSNPLRALHVGNGTGNSGMSETELMVTRNSATALSVRNGATGTELVLGVTNNSSSWLTFGSSAFYLDYAYQAGTEFTFKGTGSLGIGTTSPAAKLDVAGEVKVGNTSLACSGTTEGAIRWNTTQKYLEVCNGTTYQQVYATDCDDLPDDFSFSDVTGAALNSTQTSAILQMTGIGCTSVNVSISGGGSPQFRTCSDATCSSVIQTWTSTTTPISNNQYLQLRLTASGSSLSILSASLSVGTALDTWSVTTLDAGTFKRVFVTQPGTGGALGGISGADTMCANAASAAGLGGTYLAWIATGAADDPESRFTHASIPYRLTNGTLVANDWADLTDGNLLATINRKADGTYIGYSAKVYTNVATDGTAKYEGTNNCNGWTSNGSGYEAHNGTDSTSSAWTDGGLNSNKCQNLGQPLIMCFEQ